MDEARARLLQAEAAARLAEEEGARSIRMHEEGLVPEADRKRAEAESEQQQAAVQALEQSLTKIEMDRRFEQSEKQAMLAELERKAAEIEAQLAVVEATLARLEHELEQHRIRAPTRGTLGEVSSPRVGSVLQAGDRVAAVVPSGDVIVVAEFSPPEALGRVRPQQRGRMRLEGFPWVHYGTVTATVARVATETQNGKIRVELDVEKTPDFPVSLQHGLPGTLEIEVERVSPANLVLRSIGRALSRPASGRPRVALSLLS
jgi:membrane fusion protein (multidrug efflux system)